MTEMRSQLTKILLLQLLLLPAATSGEKLICIRASWVFDGRVMLRDKIVVIRNDRIQKIIDNNSAIPEAADVIDATGQTVTPGLIDSHIHFMALPMPAVAEIEKRGWGKLAAEGYSLMPQNRFHLLDNGITSIIDMGAPVGGYIGVREKMKGGEISGPDLFFPGPLITAPGGHPAGTIYIGQHELIDQGCFQVSNVGEARKKVQSLVGEGVNFIKIVYDQQAYVGKPIPRLDLEVATAIVDESHCYGIKVFAHAGSEEEAMAMVRLGIDGIEHSFVSHSDSLFRELARRGVILTPTLHVFQHYAPAVAPKMAQAIQRAFELHVPIASGTDFPSSFGEHCGDDLFEELRLLESLGMSRIAVLTSATSTGARKIGREKELGRIDNGYAANLVFFEGPLEEGPLDAKRISRVMLHGNMVIENHELIASHVAGFRTESLLIFPYGFWDALYSFMLGISVTEFDFLQTGIALQGDALYSFRAMGSINLSASFPSPIPKTAIRLNLHADNLNRMFYGIGNLTSKEGGIEYGALNFKEQIEATTTVSKEWKLFTSLAFEQSRLLSYEGRRPSGILGDDGGNETILGCSLAYDTRDHQNNPWHGVFVSAGVERSLPLLEKSHDFSRIQADVRGYVSPSRKHIIAGRFLLRQAFGEVPFAYVPSFGGVGIGRGYPYVRFLDKIGLYSQTEYRFPIWSILSGVGFLEYGQVQGMYGQFSGKGFHYSAGFGARFSFGSNENTILGLDVGVSAEGVSVLFRQGHAF